MEQAIIIDRSKDRQCITCGIFYCRDGSKIIGSGSLKTSSWLDSEVFRNWQQKHTANPLPASSFGQNIDEYFC